MSPPLSSTVWAEPGRDRSGYLESIGPACRAVSYDKGAVAFSQGDDGDDVRYIQKGTIKLSVVSRLGKEAVIALLGPGDFFGEGALAKSAIRTESAMALTASRVLVIAREEMLERLHAEAAFADHFMLRLLARNIRTEEDLVDQLFNSCEKRLARALLLLARFNADEPDSARPRVSQETLAAMVGTTRSRVNFFMNKFRRLGLIEYKGGLEVRSSRLKVFLRDVALGAVLAVHGLLA
jgi:CRP/FNR family transcriptional regulator, cyclic AMP receptor protein